MSAPILSVRGLDVAYGRGARRKQALAAVDLEVHPGEIVGLIGETGSGKSTLARTIIGLVPADGGSIRFRGQDSGGPDAGGRDAGGRELVGLRGGALRRLRRSGAIQYVFQDPLRSLDPEVPLGESVAEPLLVRGGLGRKGLGRATVAERVREQFRRVNLDEGLLRRLPGEVSGGQRQRAAIARALITDPRLLVLDEPVSALDSANRVQVLELLQGLAGPERGIVFISHDLGSVAGITDRVVVLYHGRVVETERTERILVRPAHPYTKLLLGSAPTLSGHRSERAWRDRLRAELG
ncbi:MAG: ABC transporter ATP-binding protein [Microbacteriaceae bacterium]